MSRNDTTAPRGFWGLLVAISGWLMPMGVYFALMLEFNKEPIWPVVRPYLLVAFTLLAVLAEIAALFMAGMSWPAKSARATLILAAILLLWNATLLVESLRVVK